MDAELTFISDMRDDIGLFFCANEPDLSPEDRTRLGLYAIQFLRIREFAWFQYQSGVLDEATWVSYLNTAESRLFSSEIGRAVLDNASGFDPEFMAYLRNWLDANSDAQ